MNFNKKFNYKDEELGWHINATTNEDFARKLTEKLERRLDDHEKCERKTRQERHAIFSQCFEEIICHNGYFGPLLSEVKKEYENCIGAVLRGERDADYLYRNLTCCISGLGTIKNYKAQIQDLERKFKMLKEQNARLKLVKHQKPVKESEPLAQKSEVILGEIHQTVAAIRGRRIRGKTRGNDPKFGKFRVKVLERYTSREQTNIDFLHEELKRLRKEIQELVKFFDKRFKLRKTKDRLIEKLMEKEQAKHDLKQQGDLLKAKLLKLEEKLKEERKQRDLVMSKKPKTILELILLALKHGETEDDFIDGIEAELSAQDSNDDDDDDQIGEQEQEEMVEYMGKFEDLFAQGCYEEAAIVAATSPQDILHTAVTFERFKEQKPDPGEKSPLLYYCEAVIVNSEGQKGLSASESVDAVVRAFEELRPEIVIQWLSQNKLKYSDLLGDSIVAFCNCANVCVCGCYILAEAVYRHTKAHGKVVSCLCRQGRLHMAVHHARNVAKFRKTDFMRILQEYPSFVHAEVLLLVGDGYLSSPLCREECMTSLVRACRPREATRLLTSAHDRIQCAKIIPYLHKDEQEAWTEFCDILVEQGFVAAARDVVSAWVLSEAFFVAKFKIGL